MEHLGDILKYILPPNRFKCGGLGGVFKTFYYLMILRGGPPDPPKGPGRLGSPDVARVNRLVVLALASVPRPTSVRTRPWHVGAHGLSRLPPRLR